MANTKEAKARIKINKLLEQVGWRFDDDKNGKANIQLEPGVKYAGLGDDFENETRGFIDFLLLDKDGRALVVVEAKKESLLKSRHEAMPVILAHVLLFFQMAIFIISGTLNMVTPKLFHAFQHRIQLFNTKNTLQIQPSLLRCQLMKIMLYQHKYQLLRLIPHFKMN